jgi:hypothetical protein
MVSPRTTTCDRGRQVVAESIGRVVYPDTRGLAAGGGVVDKRPPGCQWFVGGAERPCACTWSRLVDPGGGRQVVQQLAIVSMSGANDLERDRVFDAEGAPGLPGPVAQHGVGVGPRVLEVQAMLLQRRHSTVDEAGHVDRVGRVG